MRKAFILLSLAVFLCQISKADPVSGVDYQSQSVATVDRPLSGIINPAALGFWQSMGMQYAHSFTDSTYKGDDGFMLASKGAFFSVEWLNHDTDIFRRKFTLAIGDRVLPNFYFGASYSWFNGANVYYRDRKNWKLGLLYHPKRYASLGLVVDRINEPRFASIKQKRLYQPGVAFRPFGAKWTFSADAVIIEGKSLKHSNGIFRIAVGPFRGVSFTTDYRTQGQWRFGMTFDIEQTRIGGQGRMFNDSKYRGGTYFIEVGAEEFRTGYSGTKKTASMTLNRDIVEEPRGRTLFRPGKRSLLSIVSDLRQGANDPRVGSLLIKIEDINLDFASAQELRNALAEFHSNGKKIITFMDQAGNLGYYLASVSDEIYMNPTGLLELKGLAATTRFYKGTMDKLGVRAEILRTGPHKTFGDAFVDTSLTPEAREQIDWLLDDLYAQFVDTIASGRGLSPEHIRDLINGGPYTAEGACRVGLVDSLKHYDELTEDHGPYAAKVDLASLYVNPDYDPRWSEPKRIAVVYADGSIMPGKSGSSLLEGRVVGSKTLASTLKSIKNDPEIKSVVFRVNSPGGDVFASEEIYHRLEQLKKKKPVIISMGGEAASGGYYISCPGDEIMASPGSITGSIGVVLGKVDLSGFYHKIGIRNETIKRGLHADIRSDTRPSTPEEMALADSMLWELYDDFVNKVSTWRGLDKDSVDAIGEGRVWTGRQAKELGLIDDYGGILDAIELARDRANIKPDDRIEVATYPVYGVSFLPALNAPSLEAQIISLLGRYDEPEYYYKPAYDIKIK